MSYVYKRTEPGLWTVGFYTPDGTWEPESDHSSSEEAAKRVAWLNGGQEPEAGKLAEVRQLLADFDWEFHDRQLALEAINRIVGGQR